MTDQRDTKTAAGRILVIDDDPALCDMLGADLSSRGFEVVTCLTGQEAWKRANEEDFDAVVTDLNLTDMSGIELCQRLATDRHDVPVVVITAFGSMDTAIASIRAGAYDFITKPFEAEELALCLERAVRHRQLTDEVHRLRRVVRDAQAFGPMVGHSPAMQRIYDLVGRLAENTATVLITGESGTGKELVARALHDLGPRRSGQFVAINCGAMPETLLESELFGHRKGSFTGAGTSRDGLFVHADGGTLFLDEIGELSHNVQVKLLRALQEYRVRPVGGDEEVSFNARIVAATNKDLEDLIRDGKFREDLFYRINVVNIEVPPLRERGSDILLLAQHFLEKFADRYGARVRGITKEAAERLVSYQWPGNVRELQNCMDRAVALARFDHIGVEDLPEKLRDTSGARAIIDSNDPEDLLPMAEVERRYILRVLEVCEGNKTLAAETLGMNRKTLYRKLERYAKGKLDTEDDDDDDSN